MGRLTLNILLSFAQFEREVTGERIRDKTGLEEKGHVDGRLPSLGYDVKDKKLIINEAEAKTVRYIFRRYTELKSVRLLKTDLDARGIVSKPRSHLTVRATVKGHCPRRALSHAASNLSRRDRA